MSLTARTLGAVLLAIATISPIAVAQTPPPTPAASSTTQRTTPLSGSETALRQDIERRMGPFANAGALKSLTFKQGVDAGPEQWDAYAATFESRAMDCWIRLDASGKVTAIFVGPPGAQPPTLPKERMDDTALGDFIRAEIDKVDYSGAILVARDGKPIFSAACGLADREQKIPNTLDTRFRVGSMNKMMTATAIMQLVQAKKVKLDAPIGTYLKDYPNKDFANTVTVHHLLTHTGGAGDFFGPLFNAHRLELKTLKDYVALYGSRPPEFTPGDNWSYANYGFMVLGRIIEEVSGQTYPDYIRDHIFKPAGMTRSGFEPENVAIEGRAQPYTSNSPGSFALATDTLPWSGTSAGGGYSTVRDFLAFATALTSHKLLDAEHTKLLTTKKVSNGYAYGFSDVSTPDMRMIGHSGGAPGMNGDLEIIGDGKAVVVALSNVSPPGAAGNLSMQIVQRIKVMTPDGKAAALSTIAPPMPPATREQRMAAFTAADKANAGKLDKAGFRTALRTLGLADQLDVLFLRYDGNRDGFVSVDEVGNPPATRTTPTPGAEALARKILNGAARGEPALDVMGPGLAQASQDQRDSLMKEYARAGALQSLNFQGPSPNGVGDTFLAVSEYASRTVNITVGADGKVSGFGMGPFLKQNDAQLKASFKAIDLNADGKLDKTEYKTMLDKIGYPAQFDSLFTQIDDDKDGVITAKEYEAHPQ